MAVRPRAWPDDAYRRTLVPEENAPADLSSWPESRRFPVPFTLPVSLAVPANVVDILQACRLFAQVGARGFQRLCAMARLRRFQRGELIFRQSHPCPGVYVVGEGLVRIFKTGPGGKEHVLHLITTGMTFGEAAAIGGFDLPASAQAVEDSLCVLLPLEAFRQALDEEPEICRGMLLGMSLWVKHLVDLMEDVVLRDAAGRLASFLLESPLGSSTADSPERAKGPNRRVACAQDSSIVELPARKRHLASHLNLTSETFSRTLRRLIEAGLVAELGPTSLRILDPRRLRQVAEGLFPEL